MRQQRAFQQCFHFAKSSITEKYSELFSIFPKYIQTKQLEWAILLFYFIPDLVLIRAPLLNLDVLSLGERIALFSVFSCHSEMNKEKFQNDQLFSSQSSSLLPGCSEPLGMKSGHIQDYQITASSVFRTLNMDMFTWEPRKARLDKQGKVNAWTSGHNDQSQWLQVMA